MNLSTLVLVLLSIKATVLLCNMIHAHHCMNLLTRNKPVVENPASFANVTNSSRSPPPNIIKKNKTRFNNSDSNINIINKPFPILLLDEPFGEININHIAMLFI